MGAGAGSGPCFCTFCSRRNGEGGIWGTLGGLICSLVEGVERHVMPDMSPKSNMESGRQGKGPEPCGATLNFLGLTTGRLCEVSSGTNYLSPTPGTQCRVGNKGLRWPVPCLLLSLRLFLVSKPQIQRQK